MLLLRAFLGNLPRSLGGGWGRSGGGESDGVSSGVSWRLLPTQCLALGADLFEASLRHLVSANILSLLCFCFYCWGSIALPVAVFLSCWRVVIRALLAAANQTNVEHDQSSWCVFHSMSRFEASFPIHMVMVLRHTRTVYKTRRVCLLCHKIASWSGQDVMISPSFISALNRNGVG